MTRTYNLTVFPNSPSEAYRLRDEIREFLERLGKCEVLGGGRSCLDVGAVDLDVRFDLKEFAQLSLAALRGAYSKRAEIEVD